MKKILIIICFIVCYNNLSISQIVKSDKQRLIVTTDLGGADPDDVQSMIHLLLCSNVIDIEGLIRQQAWVDDPDLTYRINEVVEQFGEVLPRLHKHAQGYPSLDYLRSIIRHGQSKAHMNGVGNGMDSPGSELIIAAVDNKEDKRPVWLAAWGGMNTIAQALWKVKHTRSEKALKKFTKKIRIYDVLGQDDAGAWIAKNFPEITYLRNKEVYGWGPDDQWTENNIRCHAPLGKHYPKRIWATEGDSPSFFYVYANGLNVPDSLEYGGWGGRFSKEKTAGIRGMDFIERSGKKETPFDPYYMHASCPEGCQAINKWKQQIWNNFAARMMWTTTDEYEKANHHPTAYVGKDHNLQCIFKKAKVGQNILLDASKSTDPDGDSLTYSWSVYREPSSYKKHLNMTQTSTPKCSVQIPLDAAGKNIHIILEVTDNGTPKLTSYRRIVIQIMP